MRLNEDISAHSQCNMGYPAGTIEVLILQAHKVCERDWGQRRF